MATASRLERSRSSRTRGRAASCTATAVVARPDRRHLAARRPLDLRARLVVAELRRSGRLSLAASRRAVSSASMTSLRWAFAFYGSFAFIPVGMALAIWFGP